LDCISQLIYYYGAVEHLKPHMQVSLSIVIRDGIESDTDSAYSQSDS